MITVLKYLENIISYFLHFDVSDIIFLLIFITICVWIALCIDNKKCYPIHIRELLNILYNILFIVFIIILVFIEFIITYSFGYIIYNHTQLYYEIYNNSTKPILISCNNTSINPLLQNFSNDYVVICAIIGLCFIILINSILSLFLIKNRNKDYD